MPLAQKLCDKSPWHNLSYLLTDFDKKGFTAADDATYVENNETLQLEDSVGILHETLHIISNDSSIKYDNNNQIYDITETIEIKKNKFRQVFTMC